MHRARGYRPILGMPLVGEEVKVCVIGWLKVMAWHWFLAVAYLIACNAGAYLLFAHFSTENACDMLDAAATDYCTTMSTWTSRGPIFGVAYFNLLASSGMLVNGSLCMIPKLIVPDNTDIDIRESYVKCMAQTVCFIDTQRSAVHDYFHEPKYHRPFQPRNAAEWETVVYAAEAAEKQQDRIQKAAQRRRKRMFK